MATKSPTDIACEVAQRKAAYSESRAADPETTRLMAEARFRKAKMMERRIYAKPKTMELIDRLATERGVTAQDLYRRGLLLMLQEAGAFQGKADTDI